MRRDVFIENDSGGFSVVAADAVDAIIQDQRADDFRFVTGHKAMLLELWIDAKGSWTPHVSTPDFAVMPKGKSMTAIGPVANTGGWHVWWTRRISVRRMAERLPAREPSAESRASD